MDRIQGSEISPTSLDPLKEGRDMIERAVDPDAFVDAEEPESIVSTSQSYAAQGQFQQQDSQAVCNETESYSGDDDRAGEAASPPSSAPPSPPAVPLSLLAQTDEFATPNSSLLSSLQENEGRRNVQKQLRSVSSVASNLNTKLKRSLRHYASSPQLQQQTDPSSDTSPPEISHKPSLQNLKLNAAKQRAEAAKNSASNWLSVIVDKVLEVVDPGYSIVGAPSNISKRSVVEGTSTSFYTPTSIQSNTSISLQESAIPQMHFKKGVAALASSDSVLATSEFTLAATLGPDPHPEAMRYLVDLYSDPSSSVYDSAKAVEWAQMRLMVLATPEGMLSQARFLRDGKGLFGDLSGPSRNEYGDEHGIIWRMDNPRDMEAAVLIRQSAASGYPPALHAYAVYLKENGKLRESLVWFEKAFDKGVPESAAWILYFLERGIPNEMAPDPELAAEWRQKVKEYEEHVLQEQEEKRREEEEKENKYRAENEYMAFQKHRKDEARKRAERDARARREGDKAYQEVMGHLEWGYYMIAIDELCGMARAGHVDAQEFLDADTSPMPRDKPYSGAAMFTFGEYFAKRSDYKRAAKWYRNAAEVNHADAQVLYATYLISGRGLPSADPGQSVAWFMKAWASSQHKDAAMALGDAFTKGIGVPADPQKAVLWYSRAWDAGTFVDAAFACGLAYATGYPPGYAKPVVWPEVVDKGKDVETPKSYSKPKVQPVQKNFEKALHWYHYAARGSHARACNNLGEMYMMGRGTVRNDVQGMTFFKKAAIEGLPEAMYNLGRCYRDGRGCMQNEGTALMWFQRALEFGVVEAELAISESVLLQRDTAGAGVGKGKGKSKIELTAVKELEEEDLEKVHDDEKQ
ncbi:hypothetical protein HDU79_011179 [Rhizoclosmatium sp. JEL0117]|nr:hypothetical protein HDU79_011179 [Rhizoclosmatium sp. JEL0117]